MRSPLQWIKNELYACGLAALLITILLLSLSMVNRGQDRSSYRSETVSGTSSPYKGVQHNYGNGEQSELNFMASLWRKEQITLLGSSEFNESTYAPYHFLPDSVGIAAVGFGHAAHQCFSMYCELLAADTYLTDSKVCILLSPGWFNTEGTNPEAFLEFVTPNFLEQIYLSNTLSAAEKESVGHYIYTHAQEFSGLTVTMQNLHTLYAKSVNISPVYALQEFLNDKLSISYYSSQLTTYQVKENKIRKKEIPDLRSIEKRLKQAAMESFSNNPYFVDSAYFSQYLKQENGTFRQGNVAPVNLKTNQEYKDFKKLLTLLKNRKVDASFIIQPLNTYYYKNSGELDPLIAELNQDIEKAGFPCLNMFTSDKKQYEPGILRDVMHLGDLGWMKVNAFLINTYTK